MANWEVKSYTFGHYAVPGRESWITVRTITNVISGKLTMTLNDTSKLTLTVQTSWYSDIQPVKTLLEVKHGDDRKFFGNVTKVTKDVVNGTMKVDAVGVLGSLQFLPNYRGYADSVDLNGIIECESKRYLGEYQSGDPEYVESPWIDLYTPKGEGKIPSDFGKLSMSSYPSMHTTCNLDKVKRNAKNSYDFLKTITKENNYCLPTELQNPTWFKWVEYGEQAEFKPISGVNTQTISYKVNLMSGSLAISPYKSRVRKYYNMGSGIQGAFELTGTEYPIPYYYDSSTLPNKDDGSPYITAEVQKAVQHDLDERSTLIEATAFDAHLIDNTIPWLDMGKYVNVVYYNGSEETAQAQITQIEYDLVDSSKDRVKLGRIVSSITDSLGSSPSDIAKQIEEYLPRAGGQMEGSITYDKTNILSQRNQYEISGDEIHYKQTDESSSSSARVIESSVDIVPLGWVPDFSQSTPSNNQPYVAVSRKYGTSAATAGRLTSTLNGIGFSARAFDADGTSGSFTVFNPGTGSIGNTRHTLYLQPNDLHVDDRHVITCNLLDSSLLEQGDISGSNGTELASTIRLRSGWIAVKPSTTYTLSMSSSSVFKYLYKYSASKGWLRYTALTSASPKSFTTDNDVYFIRVTMGYSDDATILPSAVSNLQLEKGSQASSFVPFTMDGVEVADALRLFFASMLADSKIKFSMPLKFQSSTQVNLSISNLSDTDGWFIVMGEGNGAPIFKMYNYHNQVLMGTACSLPSSKDITVGFSNTYHTISIQGYAWSTLHIISYGFSVNSYSRA